ncbi:diaminopimelate epimerase [Paucibacter sp. PLA-PC-4]|uniref:diaminopimelate epimerase n=1 Tax=Paucibacter sp. PLA-PC-4 TaxID=2993655 RepID=UPI0022497D98|nr:diaminopimelate epimerase [Paucibacter sp. PLA-PC-4]MCX2860772.1 diaminopimelate epimerase [Paucibacter sp. PLA-PC-4]
MKLRFTKMQGAGNDFVVIDATQAPLALSEAQLRALGDRRFGVGCDQILVIERSGTPGIDFRYRIFNNDGDEVEHCGNGARCFVRYVSDKGLSDKRSIKVETVNAVLELRLRDDGRVTVDMGAPVFALPQVPFDAQGLTPEMVHGFELWSLEGLDSEVAVLSMGNPHAVQRVANVETAPVLSVGPQVERHARFPRRVNAGFMQVLDRGRIKLRVFERGAGETLACGTGACAAVVAGIRLGWLDERVDVQALGGLLTIEWAGLSQGLAAPVLMTGPAQTVFDGEITL